MAYYFASDVHLGLNAGAQPDSESLFISWLDMAAADAEGIFLVGDIFDFWFEYKYAIPPGFENILAKFSELASRGIKICFFEGNHDMWTLDYFEKECGMTVCREGRLLELCGKTLYIAHGDNVGHRDFGTAVLQGLFRSEFVRRAFRALVPPRTAYRIGSRWSRRSRAKRRSPHEFKGERESIVRFSREYIEGRGTVAGNVGAAPVDYMVFGHLHCPLEYRLDGRTTLFILGEWISGKPPVYGVMDAAGFRLEEFAA